MKFRKKPVVIEATQWFRNGDHPSDNVGEVIPDEMEPGHHYKRQEGAVVRYFRHPDIPGSQICKECGQTMHVHGWLDTQEGKDGAQRVCPGDWIITGVRGETYPCKPDTFALTYEAVA